ncbi:MAG: immunoglobulin domain-containing protein [Verrucomicrobiales bacterium]
MKIQTVTRLSLLMGLLAMPSLMAAPIPKLFSTGLDDQGQPLLPSTVDPHYKLILSADPEYQGPDAYTLAPGFPVGPWLAESDKSRWIAARPEQGIGSAEGDYTYETTFDLTGFNPEMARITGKWAVDNAGLDIILNGTSLGIANAGGFGSFTDFEITFGFIEGTNTLQFVINNAPVTPNPGGLRVELRGTVEVPDEAPSIIEQPVGSTLIAGQSTTLTVVADGTPPLEYQWKRDGTAIEGAVEATLTLTDLAVDQGGNYTVTVSNPVSSTTSQAAVVNVLEPIPGLFNTGMGEEGFLVEDGAEDPHYKLVENIDNPESDVALVQNSAVFPISTATWLPNSDTSKWIGPRFVTDQAKGGDYTYETTFNMSGLDPSTAFIEGSWTSDNNGLDIVLNGTSTGINQAGNFNALNNFRISSGFVSGVNTLQFRVNNADVVAGYTGLRVQDLRGGAKAVPAGATPTISGQPAARTLRAGESVTFTVVAAGSEPLSYQWRLNNQNITGATSPTLTINPVTAANAGSYTVVVTNPSGSITSSAAELVVNASSELDIAMVSGLTIRGLIGQTWRIEYVETPGASNWQLLDTVTLNADPFFYVDPASTNNAQRTYRLTPAQ